MKGIIWIVTSVISSAILIFVVNRMFKRPVVIKHNLNPYEWFGVHMIVYFMTLILMLFADMLYYALAEITFMSLGIKGILCLFIQSGGLIILIMIISSWIYDYYIKTIEFNYFIERHLWIKKVFFSIVCISLAALYMAEVGKNKQDVNVLSNDYKLIAMWIIVFIQIWIGFGMKVRVPKFDFFRFLKQNKYIEYTEAQKEENKYIIVCLVSMIVVPVMMGIYSLMIEQIPKWISDIMSAIYYGVLAGAFIMFCTIFIYTFKCRPNRWWSTKRFERIFNHIQEVAKTEYFERLKYELKKVEDGYVIIIYEEEIKLDNKIIFPEEYVRKVESAFKRDIKEFLFKDYKESEIKQVIFNTLSKLSNDRKNVLKEGWDIVYKLLDEKEKSKQLKSVSIE